MYLVPVEPDLPVWTDETPARQQQTGGRCRANLPRLLDGESRNANFISWLGNDAWQTFSRLFEENIALLNPLVGVRWAWEVTGGAAGRGR